MGTEELYFKYLQVKQKVSSDSRKIEEGGIYFALKGERFNGNLYAAEALDKGARYVVVDEDTPTPANSTIKVGNVLQSLQQLATYHRKQLDIPLIAIAGSNGKTTTKELLHLVLSQRYRAFATPGNLNNHIGVPLSLLKLTNEHEIAVIELGANHRGENMELCRIALPDYGIVTNVGKDHLEGFGGVEGVKLANQELYLFLLAHKGKAFINSGDFDLLQLAEKTPLVKYGSGDLNGNTCSGKIISKFPFLKCSIKFRNNEAIEISTKLFGSFNLMNVLAAACIGNYFEVGTEQIKLAVESYVPANNRSQEVFWRGARVILDAYNANPSSMHGAVSDFAEMPSSKKAIILGDMYELGEESEAEHKSLVELISGKDFETVVLCGSEFGKFKNLVDCIHFSNTEELKTWFSLKEWEGYTIFIKGSRGMKLETLLSLTIN